MDTAVAIFASRAAAEKAKTRLLAAGVPPERIAMSATLTRDAIAAEAPGEPYENQRLRESLSEREASHYAEAVRSGACVLSVHGASEDDMRLMEREGAHIVTRQP